MSEQISQNKTQYKIEMSTSNERTAYSECVKLLNLIQEFFVGDFSGLKDGLNHIQTKRSKLYSYQAKLDSSTSILQRVTKMNIGGDIIALKIGTIREQDLKTKFF
jgi:hypothetical protein